MRSRADRLVNPDDVVREHTLGDAGVPTMRDILDRIERLERVLPERQIGARSLMFVSTAQGGNYTATTTTNTAQLPGTTWSVTLPGGIAWLVLMILRGSAHSWSASPNDAVLTWRCVVDFGNGTFVTPEVDAATGGIFQRAGFLGGYERAASSTGLMSIQDIILFPVRSGQTIQFAARAWTDKSTVTIEQVSSTLKPTFIGAAFPMGF